LRKLSDIPEGFEEVKNITGVYINKEARTLVVTGQPDSDDENHNCDRMGCSSVSHVLFFSKKFIG
jgi:hypothetical protein